MKEEKLKQLKIVFKTIVKDIWKDGLLKWSNDNEPEYFNNRADELLREVKIRINNK